MTSILSFGTVQSMKRLLAILALLTFLLSQSALGAAVTKDRNLDPWYRGYNQKYFNNQLPQAVVISYTLHDDRFMALTDFDNGYFHIAFNMKYAESGKQLRSTLLHEMCHIRLSGDDDVEFDMHGPKFQSCMLDLAKAGAFEDLW